MRGFDDRTLFYDCFWHMDGKRILLVGPPPYGIDYKGATFVARPSGTQLTARLHASISVMITELSGAPAGTTAIDATVARETLSLPVQSNSCADLAGRKLLFSINKNNELAWIREWVEYHARVHGTDAVILVDNGSTRYESRQILETISSVPGIVFAGVPSWPYKFGPLDKAMLEDHWARFLQIGSMSVILRRYGELAYGLLDCDVDELAGTHSGQSMYDLARSSKGGLVVFRGTWIEAVGHGVRHRDYTQHLRDPKRRIRRSANGRSIQVAPGCGVCRCILIGTGSRAAPCSPSRCQKMRSTGTSRVSTPTGSTIAPRRPRVSW